MLNYLEDSVRCRSIINDLSINDISRRCFVDLATVNEQAIARLSDELIFKEKGLLF